MPMMQSDDQVPYPLTQIQGALAVQKRVRGQGRDERRGGWERERENVGQNSSDLGSQPVR